MFSATRVIAVTFGCLALGAARGAAQGWIETPPRIAAPRTTVDKVRSAVQVAVLGRAARVTVEEWFRNTGPVVDEGHYLYPLPGEAAFADFSLWQGDQELKGEMMDAARARAIYEAIVRQKRDPALIELAGHGLLRARVFPINPGETRKITLRYTQILDRAGDAWRFRYPGARDGATAARSFRLTVDSARRFGDPYSPTHRVSARREDGRLELTLADSIGRSDLELLLPLAQGLVGLSLVAHRPVGEDGFFMLLLAPGAGRDGPAVRRDLVAVIDVSGSMSGEKMDQAKAALGQLLGTLRAGDRFRLISFSSGVRRYAEGWTVVSDESRQAARDWVRSLAAEGGTNIAGALAEAFAAAPAADALGVVVFLTDGLPSVGESDPERIAERAEQQRGLFRVFAFGIGHDVNTYLLDRLTERARGTTEYVAPGGDVERSVGALAARVASPVLTDVALAAPEGIEFYDVQPGPLPDLFAGDELVVFGRYRGAGAREQSLTVTGRRAGREERFTAQALFAYEQTANEYVARLWAARRAAALARELRLRGPSEELMQALRQLALRYGILTEYTAYLVQEPNVVVTRGRLEELRPMAAPTAQVGAGAVERSARENKAAEAVVVADAAELDGLLRARSGALPTQRVGGRLFVWRGRDSTWTDLRHGDSLRVVRVAAFSDAYFALLRALPELVQPARLEPRVLVAGRRLSVKIEAGGRETWSAGELERLVKEFRG